VRLARTLATGLYLFGFAAGVLTLGGGCGGGSAGDDVIVPAKTTEVSPEERKGRMEAMKKAQEARNRQR
jgi:hypothetical protein